MGSEKIIISSEIPDWSREALSGWWQPNRKLLRTIRRYHHWKGKRGIVASIARWRLVLSHRFWSIVTSSDIPLNCNLGGGLKLTHPNGVVIHPDAKIGVNCLIFQQVTIVNGVEIGGHVDIGAGAKIVRPVKIGNHVKIGANAVVLSDIPDGTTAVGIPAQIIGSKVAS